MQRKLIEQYAVMVYVISSLETEAERVLEQISFNQTTWDADRFQIVESIQSAVNALAEARTDLNDERRQYIRSEGI